MPNIFERDYANEYDLLYGEKDYEIECDMLEAVFRRYVGATPHLILDLGCGTGNHAFPLARPGYIVTGVDLSESMLSSAREKASQLADKTNPVFYHSNIQNFQIEKKFDVVLMMFAVLGYQLENRHVVDALDTVRKHLKPGGIFVFDVWYGPAVLAIQPSDRIKVIPTENGQLIRYASGSLDTYHQLGDVNYHLWRIQDKQVISETMEEHRMRYFFAQELAFFLEKAGMELLNLTAFPSLDEAASESSWNVLGVGRL